MKQGRRLLRDGYRALISRSPLGRRIFWRAPEAAGVALTFDDGPDPAFTPQVLDVLAQYEAHATFFLVGEQVDRHPELVRRMVDEGHVVGNHTYAHLRCRELDLPTLRRQIERTDAALEAALEQRLSSLPLFRPPYGEITPGQALYLAAIGRSLAFWSQDARDYRGASAVEIAAFGPRLRAGDIVLLHDRFPATVEALPELLEALQSKRLPASALRSPTRAAGPLEAFSRAPSQVKQRRHPQR